MSEPTAPSATAKEQPTRIAFKGFDKDLKCRGFQYAVGETFEHVGPVKVCEAGFHACEYPLNVFDYYGPAGSRFAEVTLEGEISREENGDTKVAAARITIGAELTIPTLVQRAIEWITSRCTPENSEHATGYQGAASSTGDQGAASSTGTQGAASSTGDQGAASSTGARGAASSTGYQGAASSTGYRGAASSTGEHGVAMACGFEGKAMAGETSAIVLVRRNDDGEITHIRAAKVGDQGVKAGVWYSLNEAGDFVEVAA